MNTSIWIIALAGGLTVIIGQSLKQLSKRGPKLKFAIDFLMVTPVLWCMLIVIDFPSVRPDQSPWVTWPYLPMAGAITLAGQLLLLAWRWSKQRQSERRALLGGSLGGKSVRQR